jgi:hypothetical protein
MNPDYHLELPLSGLFELDIDFRGKKKENENEGYE